MGEEACQVAKLALLESMHALVLADEKLREPVTIDLEQVAEPLANVTIEGEVCAVLHAALNHHVAKLDLLARPDLQLE